MLPFYFGLGVGGNSLYVLLSVQFIPFLVESSIFIKLAVIIIFPVVAEMSLQILFLIQLRFKRMKCCCWFYISYYYYYHYFASVFCISSSLYSLPPSSPKKPYSYDKISYSEESIETVYSVQYVIKNANNTIQNLRKISRTNKKDIVVLHEKMLKQSNWNVVQGCVIPTNFCQGENLLLLHFEFRLFS